MSFASSSSSASALRSTGRRIASPAKLASAPQIAARRVKERSLSSDSRSASFQPAGSSSHSRVSSPISAPLYTGSSVTPEIAQSYLSDIFQLPPSRQFPPALALQILTHKSYRLAHQPKHLTEDEQQNYSANHNARLNFIGRRAIQAYLTMFVHSTVAVSGTDLKGLDFLRGKSFQDRMEVLRHTYVLGKTAGTRWEVEKYLRWDGNKLAMENGGYKIKGHTVEAIIGGLFTQYGSPAAHRAFHLHILPHMKYQMFDPILKERADKMEKELRKDLNGGSILLEGLESHTGGNLA